MVHLRATVALCVLGLLAASHAEDTARTEQEDDDDIESQGEMGVAGDTYNNVLSRTERHCE